MPWIRRRFAPNRYVSGSYL